MRAVRLIGVKRLRITAQQHLLVAWIAMRRSLQPVRIWVVQCVEGRLLAVDRIDHQIVQEVDARLQRSTGELQVCRHKELAKRSSDDRVVVEAIGEANAWRPVGPVLVVDTRRRMLR